MENPTGSTVTYTGVYEVKSIISTSGVSDTETLIATDFAAAEVLAKKLLTTNEYIVSITKKYSAISEITAV